VSADKLQPGDFGYYDAVKGVFHIGKDAEGKPVTRTPIQFAAEKRKRLRNPAKADLPERTDKELKNYRDRKGIP
jgi:hypothetical protein